MTVPRPRLVCATLAAALLGCGSLSAVATASVRPRALSAGDHTITLSVQGLQRSFILHVPPGSVVAKRPLILVYHGSKATAQGTIGVTDFEQEADRTGELVAFLQGVNNHWNEYSGVFGSGGVNDVAYTKAVISKIEGVAPFDHLRIVAAGFSNGAFMVDSLACQMAKTLSMIVPVEGQMTAEMVKSCAPARPINVYDINGTADALVSYNGGGYLDVLSAPKAVAKWAALDACAKTPKVSSPSEGVTVTSYPNCRNKVHVALRTIEGGVHRWTPDIGEIVTAAFPWK